MQREEGFNFVNRNAFYILLLYFIATSIPGLFGLRPGSGLFIAYQAVCFLLFALSTFMLLIIDRQNNKIKVFNLRFLLLYIGLLGISLVYVLFKAIQSGESFLSMAQFFLPIGLAITLLLGFSKVSFPRELMFRFLKYIVLFLSMSSVYSIIVNFETIASLTSIENSYLVDIRGFFFNRNVFGFMMASGTAMSVYLWAQTKNKLYMISSILMLISLITAMSRGAIVFLCIYLVVYFYQTVKSKFKFVAFLAIIIIPLGLILANQPFIQNNLIRSEAGTSGRDELHSFGLRRYGNEDNIVFGGGQESLMALHRAYGHDSYHNIYLETIFTQGLLGILAFLTLLLFSARTIFQLKRYDKKMGSFLVAILCGYIIYVFFESLPIFYATPNSVLITYLLVVLPVIYMRQINTANLDRGRLVK